MSKLQAVVVKDKVAKQETDADGKAKKSTEKVDVPLLQFNITLKPPKALLPSAAVRSLSFAQPVRAV